MPTKSQWTVTANEELYCFQVNFLNGCTGPANACWGIIIQGGSVIFLGQSERNYPPIKDLFVAKYVDSGTGVWHGYPVDYTKSIHDVPSPAALANWISSGYLTQAKARKIQGQKQCKP